MCRDHLHCSMARVFLERKNVKKTDVKRLGFSPLSLSLYHNIGRFFFFKREKMLSSLKRLIDIL